MLSINNFKQLFDQIKFSKNFPNNLVNAYKTDNHLADQVKIYQIENHRCVIDTNPTGKLFPLVQLIRIDNIPCNIPLGSLTGDRLIIDTFNQLQSFTSLDPDFFNTLEEYLNDDTVISAETVNYLDINGTPVTVDVNSNYSKALITNVNGIDCQITIDL